MSVTVSFDTDLRTLAPGANIDTRIGRVDYAFALRFKQRQRGRGFWIVRDELVFNARVHANGDVPLPTDRTGKISVRRQGSTAAGEYHIAIDPSLGVKLDSLTPYASGARPNAFRIGDRLLLETGVPLPFFFVRHGGGFGGWSGPLADVGIYDFDPKLSKRAVPLRGRRELDEDAGNLALVLRGILKTQTSAQRFARLIAGVLPFVSEMSVKEHVDRSVLLRCREVYDDQFYVPGPLLSDGTVNIAALVVALYFERKPLTIIEEPERNLHPALVRQLVEMMRDASERNQLLVTTHNPELVKYTDLSDLLLVTRGESGFSSIRRPEDSSLVRSFLKEDLGLDDLYVMNLFEAEA
jgi:hypothetical protein